MILVQTVDFSKEDEENPRNWPKGKKFLNVGIIAFMAGESFLFHQETTTLLLTDTFNISPFAIGLFNVHPRYSPDSRRSGNNWGRYCWRHDWFRGLSWYWSSHSCAVIRDIWTKEIVFDLFFDFCVTADTDGLESECPKLDCSQDVQWVLWKYGISAPGLQSKVL